MIFFWVLLLPLTLPLLLRLPPGVFRSLPLPLALLVGIWTSILSSVEVGEDPAGARFSFVSGVAERRGRDLRVGVSTKPGCSGFLERMAV